ncbi:nickel-dependent hydrogenase large subunit [Neptuniibacter sp.]|uniref:nickel-dependent hydrogenase large subunit n=1 Tax=Neptuniibacter sp. TaxID=1962643 RepID=UPI0026042F60|nr:nickel-dependent hydrogenase large subunit [Neptuniibacter sp.]MCP4595802.1 nickel-dependent hydrogenase large subunit [Neptuniibacter sp.]
MSRRVKVELNRVEGDLEIELSIDDGVVTDAWCIGTQYRGFEQIMIGREPMDALAITPRICGICSTAHLFASAKALEDLAGVTPPANAIRIRNICLLVEEIQSDCRQTFLMFTPDLCHSKYQDHPQQSAISTLFSDMSGTIYRDAVINSRKLVEIVAIFGGQWPHSSYMVPGGVTSLPDRSKVLSSLAICNNYTRWFEESVIGCQLDEWLDIQNTDQLQSYLNKSDAAVSQLYRFCSDIGLNEVGMGSGLLISYGSLVDPENPEQQIRSSGLYNCSDNSFTSLDQGLISEDVSHSWFHDDSQQPRHPLKGITQPKYDPDNGRYSWAKAPRYNGRVAQTGPLAQLVVDKDPLTLDLIQKNGANSLVRQFIRIHRQALSLRLLKQQLTELLEKINEPSFTHCALPETGQGIGMLEAARGSLGHWIDVKNGKIDRYQIVTPTAWNASPRDHQGNRGHIESSLLGLTVSDLSDPVEIGHVVRSHDPCLVCTVHVLGGRKHRYGVVR